MFHLMKLLGIISMLLCFNASNAWAMTKYVTDSMEITMRSGESTKHSIIRLLRSGTSVEVLDQDSESGYTHVRLGNGKEGYVLSRFLIVQPVARDQLQSLRETMTSLQKKFDSQSANMKMVGGNNNELKGTLRSTQSENEKLQSELTIIKQKAGATLAIDAENQSLKQQVGTLETQLEKVQSENTELHGEAAQQWFMIGAGAIVLGIILGLILPNMRFQRRRKSQWGSL